MSYLTETSQREFSKRMLDILNSTSEQLQAEGVDISVKSAGLSADVDNAFSAEQAQLRARADAEAATKASQEATVRAYKNASSIVDFIVGALGKDNALSKRLRNLRDEISNEAARGKKKTAAAVS